MNFLALQIAINIFFIVLFALLIYSFSKAVADIIFFHPYESLFNPQMKEHRTWLQKHSLSIFTDNWHRADGTRNIITALGWSLFICSAAGISWYWSYLIVIGIYSFIGGSFDILYNWLRK